MAKTQTWPLKFIRQVLWQAGTDDPRPVEIYTVACLRDMPLGEYRRLLDYLESNGWIEESGEPEYYRVTSKGRDFQSGAR